MTKTDINQATLKELSSVQGIGPVTAKCIIASRPYKYWHEISSKLSYHSSMHISLKILHNLKQAFYIIKPDEKKKKYIKPDEKKQKYIKPDEKKQKDIKPDEKIINNMLKKDINNNRLFYLIDTVCIVLGIVFQLCLIWNLIFI